MTNNPIDEKQLDKTVEQIIAEWSRPKQIEILKALNNYYMRVFMELLGEDDVELEGWNIYLKNSDLGGCCPGDDIADYRNQLRQELRNALIERLGKEK